ncbi:TetR/AcrR family transcriptional regulator [Rhizobium sp. C4]|uniref:TetR/AcrR family transcriptional regulator n=1 Tax=Rhizobium sp. C4 TaxID=1349800 RepID=UPI001E511D8D|nr:TetR/AcrR family transcriptional regulator [Rhizobium sp. C4]MCD2174347.1 TetR/AcrR family transcriptional regulator [Rhizobium sp. C4]
MESARRKPRSDASRNRERLIEAAKTVLAGGGPGASLEAVAREAEVGIGTLYRHFPTREALFQAVYRREVEQLIELASALEVQSSALEALRHWIHALVDLVETKRGLLGTLSLVPTEGSKAMYAEVSGRLQEAVRQLVAGAIATGEIRSDITAEDLLSTAYAVGYSRPAGPEWKAHVLRVIDIFLDGMKIR